MNSATGHEVAALFEFHLQRKLTAKERIQCEDLAYHCFKGILLSLIGYNYKKDVGASFDVVYAKMMNGLVRGLKRSVKWPGFRFLSDDHDKKYKRIVEYVGDEFGLSPLEEIVGLCQNATIEEIDSAIRQSMERGVRSPAYIRAIIQSKRKVQALQAKYQQDKYTKVDDPPPPTVSTEPVTKTRFIEEVRANAESEAVSREAEKKTKLH